ncbi:MAG: CRISPR-associated protein [Herpetosiphonaceae bacterium]|nr:MAG: CRISPR-associated protein [Herpetosiphonaceae bacterium]
MTDTLSFPEKLERFCKTVGTHRFDGLIIPISEGQAETAALLIGALKPQRVVLIVTPQSAMNLGDIRRDLGEVNPALERPIEEPEYINDAFDTGATYQALKNILDRWPKGGTYAVDVTGGTKPMSVGLAKAAHVLRLPILYISSENRHGAKKNQRFTVLPDPYHVFGDLERAEAHNLFRRHDYQGAARMFGDLEERVPESRDSHWRQLAQIYADWDVFALKQASEAMNKLVEEVERDGDTSPLRTHLARLCRQKKVLNLLARITEKLNDRSTEDHQKKNLQLSTFKKKRPVAAILSSLYHNGLRREAQGRYDVAALLLYRCLELISQHRLAQWGIATDHPSYDQACQRVPDLKERYKEEQKKLGREGKLPNRNIGLFTGYVLLKALDDDLVRGYEIADIEKRTQARNESILAHGLRLITDAEYRAFKEVVDEMLERFFAVTKLSRTDWEVQYRFLEGEAP